MERYKYKAVNKRGRPVRGVISALNEVDLYNQLQSGGLELVQCTSLSKRKSKISGISFNKVKVRDLIQFFIHMEQMQSAGVPLLDALGDIRDGSENDMMRDIMSEIYRDVRDGSSLSEAMNKHPKIFKPLYISLIKSGEDTGDLTASYLQLEKYLKWVDALQAKIKKATRYPTIVTVVVVLVVVFMMSVVVPQIVGFLKYLDIELPWFTIWLIATSNFFVEAQFKIFGWPVYGTYIVLAVPPILFGAFVGARRMSERIAYRLDSIYLSLPIAGNLIRKITIARYAQTFGALFASGIDVIKALVSSRNTVNNMVLLDAMESVENYVQAGSTLSDSLNASGEFPSMVVRMVKIGEESGQLSAVLDQVAEFYTKDVDEAIDALIEMIQPALTVILALIIVWIAAGALGPIYI
ncbi:MAG: type II secretion system F family protein, partial [Alphaproteobacteria bacterium]|nr:type II secretion system F family protein [Alphaproteobacteria bacterium]